MQPGALVEVVPAIALRKGDLVRVERNDVIPADGEVAEGVAFVDKSPITGKSAPVLKESGTDTSSTVTAGATIISDWLLVRVTADPGESFLDRMIQLVEGAKRQKTPNEIALTVLLAVLTLIFVIVVTAMAPVAIYLHAKINIADLIALLVTPDSDDHRRALICHWHCRHRSHGAFQRPGNVWKGRRSGWRCAHIDSG